MVIYRLILGALLLKALLAAPALAEEYELARQRFAEGVAAANDHRWQEALNALEASLALTDRPATRFNLILVNHELQRSLAVVRHALPFLDYPDTPARAAASTRVRALLESASRNLAVLTTDLLPPSLALFVDGVPPEVRDKSRVYLIPGLHDLELRSDGAVLESIEINLSAGQSLPWPRQGRRAQPAPAASVAVALAPPNLQAGTHPAPARVADAPMRSDGTRLRLAWTLGTIGAAAELSALGTYLGALSRAAAISDRDPTQPGFVPAANRYVRLQNTVVPLALIGGVLSAAAVLAQMTRPRRASRAWSILALTGAAAATGAGMVLVLKKPANVPNSSLDAPGRQAGGLLLSTAVPLFACAFSLLVRPRTSPERAPQKAARRLPIAW